MLDHIGTRRISVRKGTQDQIVVSKLGTADKLELNPGEWFDLINIALAMKSFVDFEDAYTEAPSA